MRLVFWGRLLSTIIWSKNYLRLLFWGGYYSRAVTIMKVTVHALLHYMHYCITEKVPFYLNFLQDAAIIKTFKIFAQIWLSK